MKKSPKLVVFFRQMTPKVDTALPGFVTNFVFSGLRITKFNFSVASFKNGSYFLLIQFFQKIKFCSIFSGFCIWLSLVLQCHMVSCHYLKLNNKILINFVEIWIFFYKIKQNFPFFQKTFLFVLLVYFTYIESSNLIIF